MRSALLAVVVSLSTTACFEDVGDPQPAGPTGTTEMGTTQVGMAEVGTTEMGTAGAETAGDVTGSTSAGTTADSGGSTTAATASGTTTGGPGASGWVHALSLEHGLQKAPADPLVDVPVLVRLTPARVDYAAMERDGGDLRFVQSLEDEFGLPHEIELWDPDGTSLVWVRVPQLAVKAGPDTLLMVYGDSAVQAWSDPRDVWSDGFVGVWHFASPGEAGLLDSSGEDNTMVPEEDAQFGYETGPLGVGWALEVEESSRLLVPDSPSLGVQQRWSLEAWVRPSAVSATTNHREILDKTSAYRLIAADLQGGRPFANMLNTASNEVTAFGDAPLGTSSWSYVVGTFDGDLVRLYVDGVQQGQSASGVGASVSSQAVQVGSLFTGRIDEMRISGTTRTAAWVELQRRSMLDTLISFGPAQPIE